MKLRITKHISLVTTKYEHTFTDKQHPTVVALLETHIYRIWNGV